MAPVCVRAQANAAAAIIEAAERRAETARREAAAARRAAAQSMVEVQEAPLGELPTPPQASAVGSACKTLIAVTPFDSWPLSPFVGMPARKDGLQKKDAQACVC